MRPSEQTPATTAILVLTPRESWSFADAILNPPDPGPVLRGSAREYWDKTSSR